MTDAASMRTRTPHKKATKALRALRVIVTSLSFLSFARCASDDYLDHDPIMLNRIMV
jgi:hypothetical protein